MTPIIISIGNVSFSAKLDDNATTRALLAQFPRDADLSELNGKEKYTNCRKNFRLSQQKKR